jgi:hypothetical protein
VRAAGLIRSYLFFAVSCKSLLIHLGEYFCLICRVFQCNQINLQKIALTTVLGYLKVKDVVRKSNAPLGTWHTALIFCCTQIPCFDWSDDVFDWFTWLLMDLIRHAESVLQVQFQRIVASDENVWK